MLVEFDSSCFSIILINSKFCWLINNGLDVKPCLLLINLIRALFSFLSELFKIWYALMFINSVKLFLVSKRNFLVTEAFPRQSLSNTPWFLLPNLASLAPLSNRETLHRFIFTSLKFTFTLRCWTRLNRNIWFNLT